tara:strand:+ start:137 stop:463 length:327 start_codon:yes stop_codon:yes gene_type:complete
MQDVNLFLMTNFKLTVFFFFLFALTSCQTIKQKTDQIVKKENEKLSNFIGKSILDLKKALGEPNLIDKNDGNKVLFVYETKKYGISCKRTFEINDKNLVIGFISKGCF